MDIVFAADKGGVGKSVVSYHVATRFRQLGYDTALIDLDRSGNSSDWVLRAEKPYLAAYPLGTVDSLPNHEVRIWDTPAHPSAEMRRHLAEVCDLVVVVTLTDLSSQKAAATTYEAFGELGAQARILLNGVHPSSDWRSVLRAIRELGVRTFSTAIRRYSCYEHAQWDGRAVCDYVYPSGDKAWSDIAQLTGEILGATGESHGKQAA